MRKLYGVLLLLLGVFVTGAHAQPDIHAGDTVSVYVTTTFNVNWNVPSTVGPPNLHVARYRPVDPSNPNSPRLRFEELGTILGPAMGPGVAIDPNTCYFDVPCPECFGVWTCPGGDAITTKTWFFSYQATADGEVPDAKFNCSRVWYPSGEFLAPDVAPPGNGGGGVIDPSVCANNSWDFYGNSFDYRLEIQWEIGLSACGIPGGGN